MGNVEKKKLTKNKRIEKERMKSSVSKVWHAEKLWRADITETRLIRKRIEGQITHL